MPNNKSMLLKDKPDTLVLEHHGMIYIGQEDFTVWAVIQTFHCAGDIDEHHDPCKFNHWVEYHFKELIVEGFCEHDGYAYCRKCGKSKEQW